MNRRELLAAMAGASATLLVPGVVSAASYTPYTRAVYEAAIASKQPFMLDFYADY